MAVCAGLRPAHHEALPRRLHQDVDFENLLGLSEQTLQQSNVATGDVVRCSVAGCVPTCSTKDQYSSRRSIFGHLITGPSVYRDVPDTCTGEGFVLPSAVSIQQL